MIRLGVARNALGQELAPNTVLPVVRMIGVFDERRLEQFGAALSLRSRYQRFFSPRGFLPGEVRRLIDPDPDHEVALVATTAVAGQQQIVGVTRYVIESDGHSAEMAIVIADEWQKRGLGHTLLTHLMTHAEQHGIYTLKGVVLASNSGMQQLALKLGFELRRAAGEIGVLEMRKNLVVQH